MIISNIANIGLILGISALFGSLYLRDKNVIKEMGYVLFGVMLMFILPIAHAGGIYRLSRLDGLVLLAIFFFIFYEMLKIAFNQRAAKKKSSKGLPSLTSKRALVHMLMVFAGLFAVMVGARITVNTASKIALHFGVSEAIIAITVISIGTSLPELMASAMAAYRGHADLAIGNIVGSNIFNQFFVLGIAASIRPLPFATFFFSDVGAMLLFSVGLMYFLLHGKHVSRTRGIFLLAAYCLYIFQLF